MEIGFVLRFLSIRAELLLLPDSFVVDFVSISPVSPNSTTRKVEILSGQLPMNDYARELPESHISSKKTTSAPF
uniref:Uncharacterized protein n=1 Tax=Ascaris lumbricoides TaxID=6252 RepID=A0A0M3HNN9_ASCLU